MVSAVGKEQVHAPDLARLAPTSWLNDEVINLYGAMITERSERWAKGDFSDATLRVEGDEEVANPKATNGKTSPSKGKEREHGDPLKVHYFNTFFYARLEDKGYEKARLGKWTKKVHEYFFAVIITDGSQMNGAGGYICKGRDPRSNKHG